MHVKGEVNVICYESIMLHYIEIVHQNLALYDQEMLMIVQLSFMINVEESRRPMLESPTENRIIFNLFLTSYITML